MKTLTTMNTEVVDAAYAPDFNIVVATWKGFIRVDDVKRIEAEMKDIIKYNSAHLFLSDTRKLKTITSELQEYFFKIMLEFHDLGINRFAVIQSDEIFTQLTVNKIISKFNQAGKFALNVFTDEKKAKEWLLNG